MSKNENAWAGQSGPGVDGGFVSLGLNVVEDGSPDTLLSTTWRRRVSLTASPHWTYLYSSLAPNIGGGVRPRVRESPA
jgi:hypothetical protein